MLNLKLWNPKDMRGRPNGNKRRKDIPRCRCGCGRIARWPLESNEPVFYTRLCGYKMALKIVRDLELEQA
jgi:hypothetical protein